MRGAGALALLLASLLALAFADDTSSQHKGVPVSGRVLGSRGVGLGCESGAPSGVQVTLSGGSLKAPLSVATGPDGTYAFQGLTPGTYELGASHPKWRIETLGAPKVEVASDAVEAPELFRVAGYDLSGSVLAEGKGVSGVPVFLYSKRYKKLAVCQQPPKDAPWRAGSKVLCQAVTDDKGLFTFSEVFCGDYELEVQPILGDLVLDFQAAAINVSVSHSSAVTKDFKVLSFAIGGLVADSVGAGVPEADVLVNGKAVTKTDTKGSFKLPNLKASTLTLTAKKPHYYFSDVTRLPVSPSMRSLPPITATSYDICAQVSLDKDSKFDRKRKVILSGAQKPQTGVTDKDGSVCFQAFPGEYQLAVEVSAAEAEAGLLFDPLSIPISLVARPLTLNSFTQTHLSVSGHVGCIEDCDGRERLTLVYLGPPKGHKAPKGPAPADLTQHVDPQTSSFSFNKVPAGRYKLSIYKETRPVETTKNSETLDTDEWCWEGEGAVEVEVTDKSVEGIAFRQAGFRMVINSTVNDRSDVMTPVGSDALDIKVGRNEKCFPAPGEYQLFFMDGCHYFGWLSFGWSTQVPFKILLDPVWYQIKGPAFVRTKDVKVANNLTDHVFAPIFSKEGKQHNALYYLQPDQPANKRNKKLTLTWRYYGWPHEEAYVQPYHDGELHPNYKTPEQLEAEEEEKKRQEREKELQILRERGIDDDEIEELAQEAARREAAGQEASILHLAGLGHLAGGQDGAPQPEQAEDGQEIDEDEQREAQMRAYGKLEGDKPRLLEEVRGEEEGKEGEKKEGKEGEKEKEKEGEEKVKGGGSEEGASAEAAPADTTLREGEVVAEEDYDEEMELYQEPGYVPEFKPFPPKKRVLFYPKRRWFKIPIYECPPEAPPFQVRWGVYLEGTIDPPISGVNVTVVVDKESKAGEWAAGETVEWGLSHEGKFEVGPLYDDGTYHLEPVKDGWVFTPLGKNNFAAEQLASLHVSLSGLPIGKPKGVPVSTISPTLTLTSTSGYTRTVSVPPGQNFSFLALDAGTYTLTPQLGEFEFAPGSVSVEIKKGEQAEVSLQGTRVAYSVSGRVLASDGERQGSVAVEAVAKDGSRHRSAVTHHRGYYRIAGLTPGVEYSIQVLTKGKKATAGEGLPASQYKLVSPSSRELVMPTEDVYNYDFVAFDKDSDQLSVTFTEAIPSTWREHIEVQVVPSKGTTEGAVAVQSARLSTSEERKFFAFQNLPSGKYTLKLELKFPGNKFELLSNEVEADFTSGKTLHAGNLHFEVRERGAEQQCTEGADGAKVCKF